MVSVPSQSHSTRNGNGVSGAVTRRWTRLGILLDETWVYAARYI